jgi:hypothetical protein
VATSSSLIRVSTEMFPEKERFSASREEFVRRVLAMDVIDHSDGRPRADLSFMPLGRVDVGTLVSANGVPCGAADTEVGFVLVLLSPKESLAGSLPSTRICGVGVPRLTRRRAPIEHVG